MIYKKIYDFCKVRNNGTAMENGKKHYPQRVIFLIDLLNENNIEFEVDTFEYSGSNLHNIYLMGTNDKWIMAHHDVCNHRIDNANDNSASVINAIALKLLKPEMNVALVDGEEPPCMGAGSTRFSERVNNGELNASWILNFELTGLGGTNFFVGNYDTDLNNKIVEMFGCEKYETPFNDASIMNSHGLNSTVINPCPLRTENRILVTKEDIITPKRKFVDGDDLSERDETYLEIFNEDDIEYSVEERPIVIKEGECAKVSQMNTDILYRCHSSDDHIGHIIIDDMKDFVEKVVVPICDKI
jgi:hypothetical protein